MTTSPRDTFVADEIKKELGLHQEHLAHCLKYLTRRQDEIYSVVVGQVPEPRKDKTKSPNLLSAHTAPSLTSNSNSLTWQLPDLRHSEQSSSYNSTGDGTPNGQKQKKTGRSFATEESIDNSTTMQTELSKSSNDVTHLQRRFSYNAHCTNVKKWLRNPKPMAMIAPHPEKKDQERMEAAKKKHLENRSVSKSASKISAIMRKKSYIQGMVQSHQFELFFAIVIVTNSFFVGLQVEYSASKKTDETPASFYIIQYVYCFVFTVEILLRIWASKGKFFLCSEENSGWNYLDVFVVGSSLFEAVMDTIYLATRDSSQDSGSGITSSASNARIVRILRIARLMRIIRVARILRFIHALRTFIYSIIATLKSLVWALVLLFMIVYLFGILFTQAAGDWHIDLGEDRDGIVHQVSIDRYWGSLPRSMFTLFKSISGGVSWDDVVHPAAQFGWVWVGVFTLYISFTYFAVLNVVTGIFCQSAIESAQQNEDLMVQAQIASKELYVTRIKKLFSDLDEDESGSLTITELEDHMMDESVQAVFASMDIDSKDAWTLFKLLAREEGCEVTSEDFVEGLMRLKGNAKRADFVELHVMIKRLDATSHGLVSMVEKLSARVSQVSKAYQQRNYESENERMATLDALTKGLLSREGGTQSTSADDDQSRKELTDVFQQEHWDNALQRTLVDEHGYNPKVVACRLNPCPGDKSAVYSTSMEDETDPTDLRMSPRVGALPVQSRPEGL